MTGAAKRVLLEVLGWLLLLAGIAAILLPGPGLLLMAAGLAVLSQQYTWFGRAATSSSGFLLVRGRLLARCFCMSCLCSTRYAVASLAMYVPCSATTFGALSKAAT